MQNKAPPGNNRIIEVTDRSGAWCGYVRQATAPLTKIAALAQSGALGVDLKDLAGDPTHLLVNRLFRHAHEARELSHHQMVQCHIHRESREPKPSSR